jgi:hypothetical protein
MPRNAILAPSLGRAPELATARAFLHGERAARS